MGTPLQLLGEMEPAPAMQQDRGQFSRQPLWGGAGAGLTPSPRGGFGSDDIRRLRGDLSQAAFARALGVTPLTVYRWELPDGAKEARRPRGQVLLRLLAWSEGERARPSVLALFARRLGSLRGESSFDDVLQIARAVCPGATIRLCDGQARAATDDVEDFVIGSEPGVLRVEGAISEDDRAQLSILVRQAALTVGSSPAAEAPLIEDVALPGFIAESAAMKALRDDVRLLSSSLATVLLSGESGTGKEVVARALHESSTRCGTPFVALNCAAVPRELFEGHLFGHQKGAFTGAHAEEKGVARAADGGTLFLDEIGELPLELQPKLLRLLENGEIQPVGAPRPLRVDVRIIAASHRDLSRRVRECSFREDLFYRLNVVQLHLPPLRERPEDIGALARHFLQAKSPAGKAPRLSVDAIAALRAHKWPGNVRELRNAIERALAFGPLPEVVTARMLRL